MTYLIAYDLHNRRETHGELTGALQHKGAKRVLSSTWTLQTTSSARQIHNWIIQFLDKNDRVLVSAIGECVAHNLMAEMHSSRKEMGHG